MAGTERESRERQELASILARPQGDGRHQALIRFVGSRPDYAEGHLYLGLSYLLNRFSATLGLPTSVIVLGGRHVPTHAPPDLVAEHLGKAEEHLNRAIELDSDLTVPATTNIAALRLAAHRYEAAIAYIEELMGDGDRAEEPMLRQHLGTAYREIGDHRAARGLFESVLDTELSLVRRNLALTYLREDDPAEADRQMREQLRLHDSQLDRLLAGAIAAELRDDREEAGSAYGEIAERCRFDGHNELLGVNAARRAARLEALRP